MKTNFTTILALLAVSTIVSFSSCKKQHSCSCKTTISASGYSSTTETSESYSEKMKEKHAKSACDNTKAILEKQVKEQQQGFNTSVACELK